MNTCVVIVLSFIFIVSLPVSVPAIHWLGKKLFKFKGGPTTVTIILFTVVSMLLINQGHQAKPCGKISKTATTIMMKVLKTTPPVAEITLADCGCK